LNRLSGSVGEIFYDNTLKTLRITNGAGQADSVLGIGSSDRLVNGSRSLLLDTNGAVILQGDIRSEGNINIDINLSDSTLRRWQFGEDGDLVLPTGGDVKNSTGQGIFALLTNYVTGASLGSTLNSYVLQNTGATGNIFTNLIDSADSSAITVTPAAIFSSDVRVENELTLNNRLTFPDLTVQRTAYQTTREITVIVDVLAPLSNVGEGTPISIVNNYQTEKVLVSNTLQGEGRVLLPNVSVYGKIVILVTTSPDETFIDRNRWNGSMDTGTITNDPDDVVILMSLAAGGWKTIT
jgi:hypothetical protein